LDVFRGATPDQDVAFVACSDDANANGIGEFLVAEIHRTQARATDGTCGNDPLQKLATGKANGFVVIVLTNHLVFSTQSTHSMTSKQIRFKLCVSFNLIPPTRVD